MIKYRSIAQTVADDINSFLDFLFDILNRSKAFRRSGYLYAMYLTQFTLLWGMDVYSDLVGAGVTDFTMGQSAMIVAVTAPATLLCVAVFKLYFDSRKKDD